MISLFWGQDNYSIEVELERISQTNPGELKIVDLEGTRDFIANLGSSSFFNDKRVFIAREILGNLSDKQFETLSEALANLDANTDVFFVESSKPKSVKVINLIKKLGRVKEYPLSKNPDLVGFIKKIIEKEGGTIAPLAAERLASFVGPDQFQLQEEVKKLVLYKDNPDDHEIQTADIELLVHANFEATVFELTDAIAAKNQKKAATLLDGFLRDGENGIYLMTMIARQFRNIAYAKFEPNISADKLAKAAGVHPYVAQKSIAQARNFDKDEIVAMYQRLSDADLKLKSGANPAQTLLRLVA